LQEPNCWVEGKCVGDFLLLEIDVPTKEDCLQLCTNETKCHWVTFHQPEAICMLLEECTILDDIDEQYFVSAERRCKITKGDKKVFFL